MPDRLQPLHSTILPLPRPLHFAQNYPAGASAAEALYPKSAACDGAGTAVGSARTSARRALRRVDQRSFTTGAFASTAITLPTPFALTAAALVGRHRNPVLQSRVVDTARGLGPYRNVPLQPDSTRQAAIPDSLVSRSLRQIAHLAASWCFVEWQSSPMAQNGLSDSPWPLRA